MDSANNHNLKPIASVSPRRQSISKILRSADQKMAKEEEMTIIVPKRWKFVRKNLSKILDYGRKENIIGGGPDDQQNSQNHDNKDGHINNQALIQSNDNEREKKDEDVIKVLNEDISLGHSAIPFLPVPMAIFCLILNIFLPGTGTVCSGFATICVGQPRLTYTEGRVFMSIVINFVVGIAQLVTITFMFVGWFWSIAWGGLLLMHSMEYRTALIRKRQEAVATAAIEALTKDSVLRKRDLQILVKENRDENSRKASLRNSLQKKFKRNKQKQNVLTV